MEQLEEHWCPAGLDYWTDGSGDHKASTARNWNAGVPSTTNPQIAVLSDTVQGSNDFCIWDVDGSGNPVEPVAIQVQAGYTGYWDVANGGYAKCDGTVNITGAGTNLTIKDKNAGLNGVLYLVNNSTVTVGDGAGDNSTLTLQGGPDATQVYRLIQSPGASSLNILAGAALVYQGTGLAANRVFDSLTTVVSIAAGATATLNGGGTSTLNGSHLFVDNSDSHFVSWYNNGTTTLQSAVTLDSRLFGAYSQTNTAAVTLSDAQSNSYFVKNTINVKGFTATSGKIQFTRSRAGCHSELEVSCPQTRNVTIGCEVDPLIGSGTTESDLLDILSVGFIDLTGSMVNITIDESAAGGPWTVLESAAAYTGTPTVNPPPGCTTVTTATTIGCKVTGTAPRVASSPGLSPSGQPAASLAPYLVLDALLADWLAAEKSLYSALYG